jgi:hypothetical protein
VLTIYHIGTSGAFNVATHIPIIVLAAVLLPWSILEFKYSLNPTLDEIYKDPK